jgi:head-tail adaptor
MLTLTAGELAAMRAEQEGNMSSSCQLLRATRTDDELGTWSKQYGAVATYRCRLSAGRAREWTDGGKIVTSLEWSVALPWNAQVLASDVLLADGHNLKILGVDDTDPERTVLTVSCREIS